MRKAFLWLALGVLALSACAPKATPTTNVPTAAPSPTPAPTGASTTTCQAVSPFFASLPSINVPAVSDADWVRGPADAAVTLIEYSDFQ